MEILVTIQEVGAYSERQYQRQDGTTEYFKSRGFTLKRGGDTIYGELTGEAASKNRDTQYYQNQPYIAKGFWKQRTWGDNNDRHENVLYLTDIQPLWPLLSVQQNPHLSPALPGTRFHCRHLLLIKSFPVELLIFRAAEP